MVCGLIWGDGCAARTKRGHRTAAVVVPAAAAELLDQLEDLVDEKAVRAALAGRMAANRSKGYSGLWRIRVGNYRLCYRVGDGQLTLVITFSTRTSARWRKKLMLRSA